jgi:hypothetical protein
MDEILQNVYNTLNTAHPSNAIVHSNIGVACFHLNKHDVSLSCHYAALEMRLELYGRLFSDLNMEECNGGVS